MAFLIMCWAVFKHLTQGEETPLATSLQYIIIFLHNTQGRAQMSTNVRHGCVIHHLSGGE